MDDKTKM